MEFHYYYLIQDLVGVMLAFIGIRMVTVCFKLCIQKSFSKNRILMLIKYSIYILSGINLLVNEFGIRYWAESAILIVTFSLICRNSIIIKRK